MAADKNKKPKCIYHLGFFYLVENPCEAVYFKPDERDDVLNRVLRYADNKNRRLLTEKAENRGKTTLFELSIVNCYGGGIAYNQLTTNCSQKPGFSGGDNYYLNGIKDISVVIAQFNNRTGATTPDEEGVFGPQANLATLLSSHAMTVRYTPDTKQRVATVLFPITGDQLTDYVLGYYNRFRPPAHNDGLPPVMAEQQYWNAQKPVGKMI